MGIKLGGMAIGKHCWKALNRLCAELKPKRILEYGLGASTVLFDCWAEVETIEENKGGCGIFRKLVMFVYGNNIVDVPWGRYDFAFIDGPSGTDPMSREKSVIQAKNHTDCIIMHDMDRDENHVIAAKHLTGWNHEDMGYKTDCVMFKREFYDIYQENWGLSADFS